VALKEIPDPGFADDDGSADPALAEALAAWRKDPARPGAEQRVLEALAGARLLVPVVAVERQDPSPDSTADSAPDPDPASRAAGGEKTSDMAVPTLTSPQGRRALPAFTSTGSLARWDSAARPVAVPLRQALQALAHEQADTLVLDLAGPVTYQLTGPALRALAEGRTAADASADPRVAAALRTLLAAEPEVTGAYLAPGGPRSDGTLALTLAPGAPDRPDAATAAVRRLAAALASDETLRSRLVSGLEIALLPPGTSLPGSALYRR
jgi:hypothetical protein